MRNIHPALRPLGISGAAVSHLPPRPHHIQQDLEMMGKPYNPYGAEPLVAGGLEELRGNNVFILCINCTSNIRDTHFTLL